MDALIELAREQLWVSCAGINDDGEIVTEAEGMDTCLDGTRRLLVKGKMVAWAPFAIHRTLEAAQADCDLLESHIVEAARTKGEPVPVTVQQKLVSLMQQYLQKEEERKPEGEPSDAAVEEDEVEIKLAAVTAG
jgi:hypothetical protein